jgi:signal transduction histidine kinase
MKMMSSEMEPLAPASVTLSQGGGRLVFGRRLAQAAEVIQHASRKQRALLLLTVVGPFFLAGLFALHQRSTVISEAHESAQRSVVALEQHAANVVDAHALILRQLDILTTGRSPDQIRNDEILRITISGFSREVTQVSTIGVTDREGNVITHSSGANADGVSVADRDYFVAHRKGAPVGIFASEAFTGRVSNERQFALSVRRTLPSGEFAGVIFTSVPLDHFTAFLRGFTPSGGHLIPMVRPDGAVIVRYPRADSPSHLDPQGPFVSHLTRQRKGIYTAVSQVDGVERINAYSQVKDYPLFISFSVETHTVLHAWRNQVLAASSIAAIVTGLMMALWLTAIRQSNAQRLSAARWEAAARALQVEVARRGEAEKALRIGAERVSFGEQLIVIVSHDLRNPLNIVSLSAAVMARRDALGPQDAQLVQRIQHAAERAARLIRDLLDFTQARLEGRIPVHPRPMDFHDLLQGVLAEVEASHPDRIEYFLDAADPRGEWDPDRLEQVIENLVLNALKYGVQSSRVRATTRSDENSLVLEVHNEGPPIPAEKMSVIFEPLQRGADVSQRNPDRSIGMGLFIVKHIVDAHGGSMSVDSTHGRGTTFVVRLPRAKLEP